MPLLRRCLLGCLAVLFWLSPSFSQAQTTYTTVVVFGDSLSDTGNIAHLTQTQFTVRYPAYNPVFGFDYTDGRFTDGTDTKPAASTAYGGVWVEQLVKLLGSSVAVKDSLDGGTNYAYGDATTGSGTTTESRSFLGQTLSITLNNMGAQVTSYLATNPTPNAQTLYVLWGGGNDLLNAASARQDPTAAATTAAANEIALVQQLMAKGATNFMLPNLPPLGAFAASQGSAAVTALNTASGVFAQALTTGLTQLKQAAMGSTLNIYQPDIFTLFQAIAAKPMSYGFGDITTVAQTVTGSPDTYLIWDGLHPTTTGHHLVAATAANLLSPLVASTTMLSVPAAVMAGGSVTASVTVTSAKSGTVPSGLVTLFSGATVLGSAPLDATGKAGITFTPAGAAGSTVPLTAVYAGDVVDTPSASAAGSVALLSAAVGTTTTLTTSNASPNVGGSVTFTATVTPASSTYGAPTGTVTFLNGTTALGTGTLNGSGVATYTTTFASAGAQQITASYAAAGLFAGSTSAAVTENVVAPGFNVQLSPTSLTIAYGGSGSTTITTASVGGYSGTLTLACGSLPAHLSCAFGSTTLTVGGTSTPAQGATTLTIATNAAAALATPARPGAWEASRIVSAGMLLPGAGVLLLFRRRRRQLTWMRVLAAVLTCSGLLGVTGCGDSGSNNNAARGSYNVTVQITPSGAGSGLAVNTVNLPITIQ